MNPYKRTRERRALRATLLERAWKATHIIRVSRNAELVSEIHVMRVPSDTPPAGAYTKSEWEGDNDPSWSFQPEPDRWLLLNEPPPEDISIAVEEIHPWRPTHRIELTEPITGAKTFQLVGLQDDGRAPTWHEHTHALTSGWAFHDGRWTLLGKEPQPPMGFAVLPASSPEAVALPYSTGPVAPRDAADAEDSELHVELKPTDVDELPPPPPPPSIEEALRGLRREGFTVDFHSTGEGFRMMVGMVVSEGLEDDPRVHRYGQGTTAADAIAEAVGLALSYCETEVEHWTNMSALLVRALTGR